MKCNVSYLANSLGQFGGDPFKDAEHAVIPRVRVVLVKKLSQGALYDFAENLQHAINVMLTADTVLQPNDIVNEYLFLESYKAHMQTVCLN